MAGPNGKRSLEEIFEEHLAVTKTGFDRVNQNIAELTLQMQQGFARVDGRFDNMIETMGESRLGHEARIAALEAAVAKLKAG